MGPNYINKVNKYKVYWIRPYGNVSIPRPNNLSQLVFWRVFFERFEHM